MTNGAVLRAKEDEMNRMLVLVAISMMSCDKSLDGAERLPHPPLPPEVPHASILETCEALCAAREQVKEQTVRRDELQREVDDLTQKVAARMLAASPK
jgi:hypothetical protein